MEEVRHRVALSVGVLDEYLEHHLGSTVRGLLKILGRLMSVILQVGSLWDVARGLLVMLSMGKETVGVPVPGSGVQVTKAWSSVRVMMPSFFL